MKSLRGTLVGTMKNKLDRESVSRGPTYVKWKWSFASLTINEQRDCFCKVGRMENEETKREFLGAPYGLALRPNR